MGVEQIDGVLYIISGSGHHQASDRFQVEEGPAGANQDGHPCQIKELFGVAIAEAGTDAPGRNDDPGRWKLKSVAGHVCVKKRGEL